MKNMFVVKLDIMSIIKDNAKNNLNDFILNITQC